MMCSRFFSPRSAILKRKKKMLMGSLLASNYFKQKFWKFCSLSSSNLRMINHQITFLMAAPHFHPVVFCFCYGRALAGGTGWQILKVHFCWISKAAAAHLKIQPVISALMSFYVLPCTFSFPTYRAASDIFISEVLGSGASDFVLIRGQISINLLLISLGWKLLIFWLLGSSCPGIALWRD